MRVNLRPSVRAIDWPSEVLPTPGGPTKQRIGPATSPFSFETARYSTIRSFTFSRSKWSSSRICRACSRSRVSSVVLSQGRVRIQSRYVRITPYSAAAGGSFSSRESSRSAALRTSSGSSSAASCSRSSFTSACCSSPSPSSSWIAFSCWRRKYSRWPFSISDWTCDWIFEPSSITSSSRFRIVVIWRSRSSTFAVSSSCCFSSVFRRIVEATRCESALGSSTFTAAIWSSSGRYGTAAMIRPKRFWTLRVSASSSFEGSTISGTSLNSPTRYGSSLTRRSSLMRRTPWTRIRSVPSGTRISLCTIAAVPISYRSSKPGGSTSSSFTVTSATMRSPPATSSISLIERSWPIASGVIDSGKTTVSFSGRTGRTGGTSTSCSSSVTSGSRSLMHASFGRRGRSGCGRCAAWERAASRP